jgi:hypothetical protein
MKFLKSSKRENERFEELKNTEKIVKVEHAMRKSLSTISCMAGIVVLLFCMGCTGTFFKNYGGIAPDRDATKAFETYQINPDFNYYTSGSFVYPNALMGLEKTYILDSDLWKKIEPTPQEFREIIQNMQTKALNLGLQQHGFVIMDNKEKRIGVWYSILTARTVIKMMEGGKVVIFTPDLDTYERYERNGGAQPK